jgi:hypothetical protein
MFFLYYIFINIDKVVILDSTDFNGIDEKAKIAILSENIYII